MLETIRQYASGQLERQASDRAMMMRRMRDYWSAFGMELVQQQNRADGARWLAMAQTEWDNLRAVLSFCVEDPPSRRQGLQLASNLCVFCEVRGYIAEGRDWLERLLESEQDPEPTRERFAALCSAGVLSRNQADYMAACDHLNRALEMAKALDMPALKSMALNHLGTLHCMRYEYEHARDYLEQSLQIAEQVGTPQAVASCLNNLALALAGIQQYEQALSHLKRALEINRQTGNRKWQLHNLQTLGSVLQKSGDDAGARPYFQEALALSQELDIVHTTAKALIGLGIIALHAGALAEAEAHLVECLPILDRFEDRDGFARTALLLTDAALQQGRWEDGAELLAQAEATFQEIGVDLSTGMAPYWTELLARLHEHPADTVYRRALEQARTSTPAQRLSHVLDRYPR
jgi:tetratricopeptide (TPR) repeat protein